MSVLLKNNLSWTPKQSISSAFFEDVSNIINNREEYQLMNKEIEENLFLYSFTLDYRDRHLFDLLLLLEVVIVLIYHFDEIYLNRTKEEAIVIYKDSILELKNMLFLSVCNYT
ncbi:hypothetical protein [Runella sp.]|uniref:hypothetical protein n=1 Tax=Runella sp. TaxID=1960881 RepID=UPI003D1226E4